MNKKAQIIIIVFLTTLAYINIFQNQFIIDDKTFIVNWEKIRNLENIGDLLKGAVPSGHEGVYRPLRSVLYVFYYQIWGTNPVGYHLHSILVHLLSTILVYLIIEQLVLNVHPKGGKLKYVPFIGGLLFGLHPVHTESITYISASMEMTGVVFFLLAFLIYLRSLTHARPGLARLASYFFALLALFTYEMTLTLPLMIILYDVCFRKLNLKNLGSKIRLYVPYFGALVVYTVIRLITSGLSARGTFLGGSIYLTFLASIKVLGQYILLSFLPLNLTHNHIIPSGIEAILYRGHSLVPVLAQNIFEWEILASPTVLIIIIIIVIKSYKKYPLVSFSLGWFLLSLFPASNLIPQWSLMHEKFLYLPSVGVILLFVYGLARLIKQTAIYWLIVTLILVGFMVLTINRNHDWRNAATLWSKDISMSPAQNAYAYFQLGEAYLSAGNKEEAIKSYQKAFEINPSFAVAAGSMARTYAELGKADLAIEFYQKAIKADPNFWEGAVNLQNLLDKKQEWVNYSGLGLSFSYPKEWRIEKENQVVRIKNQGGDFVIEMEVVKREGSIEEYLSKQTRNYGILINQGLAQIPNFSPAYVKIWQDHQTQKMEFFLFKDNKVIKILVYPSDSSLMRIFDRIAESLL